MKIGVSEEKTDNVIMNDKKGENEKTTKETELKTLQPTEEKKKMNKSVYDEKLPIIIQSKKCGYDLFKDEICDTNASITRSRKIGYIFTDTKKRILGVVYRSDDERKIYYGMAEILFFKRFKEEFGTWRIIKINAEPVLESDCGGIFFARARHGGRKNETHFKQPPRFVRRDSKLHDFGQRGRFR